jgi:hypothetical protein
MRLGALSTLKMGNFRSVNIENDKQIKLYQITIYEGEPEEYITFCTPECSTDRSVCYISKGLKKTE